MDFCDAKKYILSTSQNTTKKGLHFNEFKT